MAADKNPDPITKVSVEKDAKGRYFFALTYRGVTYPVNGPFANPLQAAAAGEQIIAVLDADMTSWQGDGLPAAGENLDVNTNSAVGLAQRLSHFFPRLDARPGSNDAAGYDLVVNATPLGRPGDPLPMEISRLAPETFVGEVVMKAEMTPLLQAAQAIGCRYQVGADMLFEMIPAYLEFFGYGTATPDDLRAVAKISY